MSKKVSGFTLVEIMIVVAIIAFLVAMAIPLFARARESSQKNTCIANMRLIDSAVTSWALEAKKGIGDSIDTTALFGPDNLIKEVPACPGGGTLNYATVGAVPQVTCSLVGLGHALP